MVTLDEKRSWEKLTLFDGEGDKWMHIHSHAERESFSLYHKRMANIRPNGMNGCFFTYSRQVEIVEH